MSQEQDQTKPTAEDASGSIKLEASPFEPGFQPESIPKISVPDIPVDAVGLTAEALAQVPTLTDQVEEVNPEVPNIEAAIQEAPVEADTGGEEFHARMDKLTNDIHQLNARLDRLEEKIQIEV
ncbi:MAG: hypothetical protein ACOVKR_07965 [Limnohabitans sp.]|jgi:outer membrane murein-binding lipoprotein Lpp